MLDNTTVCVTLLSTIVFHGILPLNISSLFCAAFSTRLFAVLRFESVIHEFDP